MRRKRKVGRKRRGGKGKDREERRKSRGDERGSGEEGLEGRGEEGGGRGKGREERSERETRGCGDKGSLAALGSQPSSSSLLLPGSSQSFILE